jgi:hypothetical protein
MLHYKKLTRNTKWQVDKCAPRLRKIDASIELSKGPIIEKVV